MAPTSLPLFPLPNVVLFPNVFLPLHIFEPRYRQMIGDVLSGDRTIGMVLLRPGYEKDYDGAPPIYSIGCSGVITHSEQLEDGRYNLILRGLEKFTVEREEEPDGERLYRSATISTFDEAVRATDRDELRRQRLRLETLLAPLLANGIETPLPAAMPDEDLVNVLSQYLKFDPLEKLALLEREGVIERCRTMVELLEMKLMGSGFSEHPSAVH